MLSYYNIGSILKEIKRDFQKEIRKTEQKDYGTLLHLNRARVRDIAIYFYEKGLDLINLAIHPSEDKFLVIYEYYYKFIKDSKYVFIITEVDKKANELDSIELVYPHAKYLEEEISKRYGINFLSFSEEIKEELFVIPTPLKPKEKEKNFLFSGIYNKIHDSSQYFHLRVKEEKIEAVAEKTGWLYRGIIPMLNHHNIFTENMEICKHICTPGSFHHQLAYCMAIEKLAGLEIQNRVKLMRTLLCELDRIDNHLIFFANLLYNLAYKRAYHNLLEKRLSLHNIYLKYFKSRYLEDFNFLGYTGDLNKKDLYEFKNDLLEILPKVFGEVSNLLHKSYVEKMCKGIGILSHEKAKESGVTGPTLRASGVAYDIRYEKPYLSYLNRDIAKYWDIPTFQDGDVYSRIETRLYEMRSSNTLIFALIEKLIKDIYSIEIIEPSQLRLPGNAKTIVQLESPRGELVYSVLTNEMPNKETLGGAYIATPSMKNFLAANDYILPHNNIRDFSLIIHSLDLNFNELDL
jgi:Ni,Fe-hydrogenase III large subunit/Ni,Fe-hydrogenase III component G